MACSLHQCERRMSLYRETGSGQMEKIKPSVRNREHDAVVIEMDLNSFPNQVAKKTLPLPAQLPFCPSIAHMDLLQTLVPPPAGLLSSFLDLGSSTSSQDDRYCSTLVDGIKSRFYFHRTKLSFYTFLWKLLGFDK